LTPALEVELKELSVASFFIHYMSSAKLVGLIKSVDPNGEMIISVLGSERLTIGKDPLKPTYVIDFSKEVVAPLDPTDEPIEQNMDRPFWFELLGEAGGIRLSGGAASRSTSRHRKGSTGHARQAEPDPTTLKENSGEREEIAIYR
jgi:hypothetical protein